MGRWPPRHTSPLDFGRMSPLRCLLGGHDWVKRRYPEAPPDDDEAVFSECTRCGKQREIDLGPIEGTLGGKF